MCLSIALARALLYAFKHNNSKRHWDYAYTWLYMSKRQNAFVRNQDQKAITIYMYQEYNLQN